MKELRFSIDIRAPRGKVWSTLWDDKTFRDWSSLIDEGTYMVGELKEGNEVQFISSHGGYGVTSFVEKCTPGEFVLLRHTMDTKDSGAQEREKQWIGGTENYTLTEQGGITTVTHITEVPPELEEMMETSYAKALERIKVLAEGAE